MDRLSYCELRTANIIRRFLQLCQPPYYLNFVLLYHNKLLGIYALVSKRYNYVIFCELYTIKKSKSPRTFYGGQYLTTCYVSTVPKISPAS